MGLVGNVTRRGGVYWWRGRFGSGKQTSRIIARSLGTRDPDIARVRGSQITGLAMRLRQSVRQGSMTVDAAASEISACLATSSFSVDPKLLERLELEAQGPQRSTEARRGGYSIEQESAMLADFVRRMGSILERHATEIRTRPPLVLDRIAEDWVEDAIRNYRVQAEVCRLLALSGTSARLRPIDKTDLRAVDFTDDEIDAVHQELQRHANRESGTDWMIGPDREVLIFHLQAVGAVPDADNVVRLRRAALFVLSDLLRAHAKTFRSIPERYSAIAAGVVASIPHAIEPAVFQRSSGAVQIDVSTTRSSPPEVGSDSVSPSDKSFLQMVDLLIITKTRDRSREWDDKTARQHRSIAKLFVKLVGSDNPTLMTQQHVGQYLDLLRVIPTHYGKSIADEDRSINEILARSEDLDESEIGLAPPTINRHRGQLRNILKFMKRHGFSIGEVDEGSRAKDLRAFGEKRAAFSFDDGLQLMSAIEDMTLKGRVVDPDSLYWVSKLAWYQALRLSEAAGLAPSDVDIEAGLIHIQQNALRRIKTRSSMRILPIHPELERLGFRRFVRSAQASGSKQLFPGLFERSSEFGAVFQKMWTPVLDAALPSARQQRKTLHSTRKTGNSAMHVSSVKDNTRLYILGHAKADVNGRHYLSPPSSDEILDALLHIPNVTEGLPPRI